jgi:hypothetical protein
MHGPQYKDEIYRLAEWLERQCQVTTVRDDPCILRHSAIQGAADEAVWNKIKYKKIHQLSTYKGDKKTVQYCVIVACSVADPDPG